jgi:tetratricopeptide (TPR) repeat protein
VTLRAFVLIIVSLVACVASAQNGSGSVSEARVHFDRGVELYREGSLDAALAEFERSNQLAPNYKILYNLAQVQAERHQYVAAVKLLTEYLQTGGNDIQPERRQLVTADLEKLRQRIASLSVEVNVDGAEVFVNDISVGRSPLPDPVLVNVGTCRVRAEKSGHPSQMKTITVAGADRPRVKLELVAGPVVAQQAPRPTTTITTSDMTPFWISLGATVVLGGATAVFGALTLSANQELDQALDHFPAQEDAVESARQDVKTMAALTDGFAAATIVGAGFAVYFLIAPPEDTEVVPATGVHARISPLPTGLAVSGTF